MRLDEIKIRKLDYDEGKDENDGSWLDPQHCSVLIPHDMRMITHDNRRDMFKGTFKKVIIENDWDYIGSEPAKDISYRIKLYHSRAGGSNYDMTLIR